MKDGALVAREAHDLLLDAIFANTGRNWRADPSGPVRRVRDRRFLPRQGGTGRECLEDTKDKGEMRANYCAAI
jgi:hypothetical protein